MDLSELGSSEEGAGNPGALNPPDSVGALELGISVFDDCWSLVVVDVVFFSVESFEI